MKKRQIALAAAICTALTSVGFVGNAFAAEKNDDDLMSFNLAEIVVHGNVTLPVNLSVQHLMLVF